MTNFRRVVTGHDDNGRSVIVEDGVAPVVFRPEAWPTCGSTLIWVSDKTPAGNLDGDYATLDKINLLPVPGGTTFMIMEIAPEAELDSMPPEQRQRATLPVARFMPTAMERPNNPHYFMHTTDTIDYCVVLKGEVSLMMDEGEVLLRPFDTVIQRGGNHGWVNRGTELAIVAATAVDAEPIDRDALPPRAYADGGKADMS